MNHQAQLFYRLFPLWVIISTALGIVYPNALSWFSGQWIVWALSLVMLGMGFTLSVQDFRGILRMPVPVVIGVIAQYTIMPLAGWAIVHILELEGGLAVGVILVACCPSGTASNFMTYLAKANVALAVTVTLVTTMLAFVMTPIWCKALAGAYTPVDIWGLSRTTLQVIVVPILVGVYCRWRFPRTADVLSEYGPSVSVIALVMIAGGIAAQGAETIRQNAGKLLIASILLHVTGFTVGYVFARLLRLPEQIARTISIEVGMQNGGLAMVLAKRNFPLEPLAAVPAVFCSVVQTVLGSILAGFWSKRIPPKEPCVTPDVKA
jgi:BASS family bile acid:Na+ symporter